MRKIKSAVLYQYTTKLKAIAIFYTIQYAIVALIAAIAFLATGTNEIGSNCLEFSALVFVSIIGAFGFKEDFKALIQNGFTRKYIFLSTICMFVLLAGTMALIDTIIGNAFHALNSAYVSIYGALYGYGRFFTNWLCLTVLYLAFCTLFYLVILVINKAGKKMSLVIGVLLGGGLLLVIALFRYVIPANAAHKIGRFFLGAMGFLADGTIHRMLPVLSLFVVAAVLGAGSYAVIRRTELK